MERKFEHLIEGKPFKNGDSTVFKCDGIINVRTFIEKIYTYVLHIIVIIAETQAAEI